ncbi:protein kinase [bacterium]|nr:protein kinase [bacterium]
MPDSPTLATCPDCGIPFEVKAELRKLCPRCLMQRVMAESQASAFETGSSPKHPKFAVPAAEELEPLFPQFSEFELLGVGGMGAVFRARQISLDRTIALKLLPRESGADPAFAERFAREARALAKLSHPHIVGMHDFGESGGYYYFVMEFVEGVTLREAIRRKSLTPAESLRVVSDICEALQFAHDQGIVHRDIKPENILLSKNGQVKIADFGLAKLLSLPESELPLTASRHIVGTPHYMAPEQMERPLEVDHRADIYSLGVVFYEMLTGELPIGRFDPPSRKVIVDVRLDEVVLRTLEKEPGRRYQHVSDVGAEVEHISGTSHRGPWLDVRRGVRAVQHWCRDRMADWRSGSEETASPAPSPSMGRRADRGTFFRCADEVAKRVAAVWRAFASSVRPAEFLLAMAVAIASMFAVVLVVNARYGDNFLCGILLGLLAIVVARGIAGRVESWDDLRPAQWLILPTLAAGYLVLLFVLLVWPGVMVFLFGAAPLVLDVDPAWSFLGENFVDLSRSSQIPRYWTLITCVALSASAVWWIGVSLLAKLLPRSFCVVFHPSSPAQVRVIATYVILIALVGLAPVAALCWSFVVLQ